MVVGKSKSSKVFKGIIPPLPYKNKRNALFDRDITRLWINNILLPYHNEQHGREVPCALLVDNCSDHKISDEEFSVLEERNIFVRFLPPNITRKRQPSDMSMIAPLDVGYKTLMINKLLDLFDEEGGFELAGEKRNQ